MCAVTAVTVQSDSRVSAVHPTAAAAGAGHRSKRRWGDRAGRRHQDRMLPPRYRARVRRPAAARAGTDGARSGAGLILGVALLDAAGAKCAREPGAARHARPPSITGLPAPGGTAAKRREAVLLGVTSVARAPGSRAALRARRHPGRHSEMRPAPIEHHRYLLARRQASRHRERDSAVASMRS